MKSKQFDDEVSHLPLNVETAIALQSLNYLDLRAVSCYLLQKKQECKFLMRLFVVSAWTFVVLAIVGAPTCLATVVTFDDLSETGSGSYIANGYQGLNWNNVLCNNAILFTNVLPHLFFGAPANGLSGNYYGMTSSSNVAVVFAGSEITSSGTFDFLSAFLTGFWNSNLNIEVQGFSGATLLYDTTVVASATSPTLFTFDYQNIDRLTFNSSGGQPAFGNDNAGDFVMDGFNFEIVPEPSSLLLTGLAALLLWPILKRKRM